MKKVFFTAVFWGACTLLFAQTDTLGRRSGEQKDTLWQKKRAELPSNRGRFDTGRKQKDMRQRWKEQRETGDSAWESRRRTERIQNWNVADPQKMTTKSDENSQNAFMQGQNEPIRAALPLRIGYVLPEVVSSLQETFGSDLYSITTVWSTASEVAYVVTTIRNDSTNRVVVDENGRAFTAPE